MKNKIIFAVSLVFGLIFINAGLNKFFNYMPVPEDLPEELMKVMGAFMQIVWLMPLVAVVEIIGGVLFIIPKTRTLGSIVIFPVMVGILLTNTITELSGLPKALVLFAINLWVIFENIHKYKPLVKL